MKRNDITGGNTDLITDFGGATSGVFFTSINFFTVCYSQTGNLKARINLNTNSISVISYTHFNVISNTNLISGSGTNELTSMSDSFAKIGFKLNDHLGTKQLVFNHFYNACGNSVTARINESCWSSLDTNDNGDLDYLDNENIQCSNIIDQKNDIPDGSTDLITDFDGVTSGAFFTKINIFTICYNQTATLKAKVNLDNNTITVESYSHFNSSSINDPISGSGTNELISEFDVFAKIGFKLVENEGTKQLLFNHIRNACMSVARIDESCWDSIDDDDNPQCSNIIDQKNDIPDGSTDLITDFDGVTSGTFFTKINIFTICYNQTATLKAKVNLNNNTITVESYSHFNSSSINDPISGSGTNELISEFDVFAKIGFKLVENEGTKQLLFNHIRNACMSVARIDESCWDSIDDDDNPQCSNIIDQKNDIPDGSTDLITDFDGVTSGTFFTKINIFTICYNQTATLKAKVNLNNNTITVESYSHFNSSSINDPISGSGTNELISEFDVFAKIGFKLVENEGTKQLLFNHIRNACMSVARIDESCWDSIDDDDNPQCSNIIDQKNDIPDGSTDLITDFDGATSGTFFTTVNIFTICHAKTATLKAWVNLNANSIIIQSYTHFNGTSLSDPIYGTGTDEIISGSDAFAKIGFKLVENEGTKQLLFNHIGNACGSVARINKSCWEFIDTNENPMCSNIIEQKDDIEDQKTDIITDFNSATSGVFYATANIFTICYAKTATLKAWINLDTNQIFVDSYTHFNNTSLSDPIYGTGTDEIISGSGAFAKIGFKLVENEGTKQLLFNHIGNACGSVARINESCWNSINYDNNDLIKKSDNPIMIIAPASNVVTKYNMYNNQLELQKWLTNNGGAVSKSIYSKTTWTNNYISLINTCGYSKYTKVTFTTSDKNGYTKETTATFTIIDKTNPTWQIPPSDMVLECNSSTNLEKEFTTWLNTFSGTSNTNTTTVTHNSKRSNFDCKSLESENVTFFLSDACGNTISKMANFSVKEIPELKTSTFNNLAIYPNPSNGSFTISFNLIDHKNIKILLNDLKGRVIDIKEFKKYLSKDFNETFDYRFLPSGIYFISIRNSTSEITKQITIH